jgi:type IV secretory system conjugative DNA transfer VirD4/TraG family protein
VIGNRSRLEYRVPLNLLMSVCIAWFGTQWMPYPLDNALVGLIALERPRLSLVLQWGYLALWTSSAFLMLSVITSTIYIWIVRRQVRTSRLPLPPYPAIALREQLFVVLGERHHATSAGPAAQPTWLTIPERGLYTGIAIVGAIGSGKTSACVHPYVEQLLGYKANRPGERLGGLVLEVKGDFCREVRGILERYGRGDDYIEISLTSEYRYNPLHNDLDAYALAFGIATLMTNLFGRGKEPFWQQASTNLIKFVILLHQVLDDYVTLFQVYEHVIDPGKIRARIAEGQRRFAVDAKHIVVSKQTHLQTASLTRWNWRVDANGTDTWTTWSSELETTLRNEHLEWQFREPEVTAIDADKRAQFEAVQRWFEGDWTRIEPKLQTSIVEGVSVFLSLFDDNPRVKHTFCPPKSLYGADATPSTTGIPTPATNGIPTPSTRGVPLPPIGELIEHGKVIALNFPAAMNPALARGLGTMLKQDFQRAVLNRIPKITAAPGGCWRPVLFLCDEYQAFATSGENEPSGDEKFFSLSRQAKCIPIVATQSLSSIRSTLPGEAWRTLLQGLRTKIFLTLSDDFSARFAADLCGRAERLKTGYTLTEAGQDARVSLLTARATAHRATVSATKTYSLQFDYVFQPKTFTELQNAQAIVLAYDGMNPLPPTFCYLKPHYLDVQTSYFEHAAEGRL